ncbi:MAG: zinc ribbon domain-containing protein [Phycisphaerales bacterium]|nr:zinc ribbon domain-containing protein [Phycisphaerales bacterium]
MADRFCDQCGAAASPAARYCRQCGVACDTPLWRSLTRQTTLMQQWRGLSHTLTRRDVRKLLGEPARVEPANLLESPRVETWRYEYERVDGSAALESRNRPRILGVVQFSQDEGRVLMWTEPDWEAMHSSDNQEAPSNTEQRL